MAENDLVGLLSKRLQSPLFQMGAGMFASASRGNDIGTGFLQGGQAAQRAQQGQMRRQQFAQNQQARKAKLRQQQAATTAAQTQKAQWQNLSKGRPLLQMMGPQRGSAQLYKEQHPAPVKPTSFMQNYQFARQNGFQGTPADFKRSSAAVSPEMRAAQLAKAQADANRSQGKADLNKYIMELIQPQGEPEGQAPLPGEPQVIPQSFDPSTQDPNLVLTAGGNDPAPAEALEQDEIETPFGSMTRERAGQLAGALALSGNQAGATLMQGAINGPGEGLQNPTKNRLEQRIDNSQEALSRISEIGFGFKPEYQTISGRLGFSWDSLKAKFDPGSLEEDQQQELGDFAAWRQDAWDNANRYIKEITGAQMSEAEALRLLRALPNPGTGWFDGDDPISFKRKMDSLQQRLRLTVVRTAYLRKQGFRGTVEQAAQKLSTRQMEVILDQRHDQIEQQLRRANPRATQRMLAPLVKQQMKQEYGI